MVCYPHVSVVVHGVVLARKARGKIRESRTVADKRANLALGLGRYSLITPSELWSAHFVRSTLDAGPI